MDQNYKIFPLADTAATIDLGNSINEEYNKKVLAMCSWIRNHPFEGLKDIIVAYSSLTLYYDPISVYKKYPIQNTIFDFVKQQLETAFHQSELISESETDIIRIPVCYGNEFAIDMDFVSHEKKISREEIIHLHVSKTYRVYMIGFLPGFSYLGKIDEKLVTPRKQKPISVLEGSVAITGNQTGIYPMSCPGGWQVIGRTPLTMFNQKSQKPVLLDVGNHVQFYEISRDEFQDWPKTD